MFKVLRGYVRRHVENKVRSKRKVENGTKKQRAHCYCSCDRSFFADYFRRVRKFANCKRSIIGLRESTEQRGTDDTFKTEAYLRNPWIEAIGWSGTVAFGWTLHQHFHFYIRRQNLLDYTAPYPYEKIGPQKHLCPHLILKNILLSSVSAQPDNLVNVKSLLQSEKVSVEQSSLPIFGPKTADQALNEATEGMKKVHNESIGELENRQGLRCMSKQHYRKAVIHFAAGSALQNNSATFNLAQCYELGLGTRQSYKKAAKWYRLASDQGNASATYNLAVFYAHGYGGLKPDRDKAIQLLQNAGALGEPNAKRLLDKYVLTKKKTEPSTPSENEKGSTNEIAEVQTRFAALRLPLTRTNRVTEDNIECYSSKSNSFSTDDGLASEYESSNSSGVSYSGSSCQTESSSEAAYKDAKSAERCKCIYEDGKAVEGLSSYLSNLNFLSSHSKMSDPTSKSESIFGYPSSLFLNLYRPHERSVTNFVNTD